MKQINTKFGEIYIEEIGQQEEEDRIKIYDSDDKYLEYWGVDTIEDYANSLGVSSKEWVELWVTGCKITNDIKILLDTLAIDYSLLVEGSLSALNAAIKADLVYSMSELQDHELVNRIGNFYIFHRDADMGTIRQTKKLKKGEIKMEKELISSREYEVVEVCPHCDSEIVMQWSIEYRGYKAFCPVCGGRLMLCDECFHAEDNPSNRCDWCVETDTCFRRTKEERK